MIEAFRTDVRSSLVVDPSDESLQRKEPVVGKARGMAVEPPSATAAAQAARTRSEPVRVADTLKQVAMRRAMTDGAECIMMVRSFVDRRGESS